MNCFALFVALGLGALAARPAHAQNQVANYGYGQPGGLDAIINAILGTQNYGYGGYNRDRDRFLIDQCARATELRLQRDYGGYAQPHGGYGQPYV